jgi:prephenate dehydrogenase
VAPIARGRQVAIIGLGCIGGSLARALVAQGVTVRGWSVSASDREQAARAGIEVVGSDGDGGAAACADAALIVLAVPLERVAMVADGLQSVVGNRAVFVHTAGLQRCDALGIDAATHSRLIGTHPLAGTHDSGFAASRADLFVGAVVSVEERADARVRAELEWLWRTAGASRIDYRPADVHDRLMAWVSHLPQLTATALAATLADGGIDPLVIGTGARDTTRLAASELGSWPALFRGAPHDLRDALEQLEQHLRALRLALNAGDAEALRATWETARNWRRQGNGGARVERPA